MSSTSTLTLVIRRQFSFPAERVFEAWLDPALARQFLYTTDESEVVRCEIDARVGGGFVIVDRRASGEEILHRGVYKVIERPRRLVFTLQVPQYAPEEDDVTVEITPTAQGCEVLLKAEVQTSVLPIVSKEDMENGWTMILNSLNRVLTNSSFS